jgi:hypothetical protein
MNAFSAAVSNEVDSYMGSTENGLPAHLTTKSKTLDFFGFVGSARGRDMTDQFLAALAEDEELAIRVLLWARDVRGGAGERQQFRNLLTVLDERDPVLASKIMHLVPVVGRADDLFAYKSDFNRRDALEFLWGMIVGGNQLAAKWAPRIRSKSNLNKREKITEKALEKNRNALDLMRAAGVDAKTYRKTIANATNAVETQMSAKKWDEIDFSKVPSLAAARYQKAFGRNATLRYDEYIKSLEKGEAKINAGAVYPYDVIKTISRGNPKVANQQWKALPDYVKGNGTILPMVDVSGSMQCETGITGMYAMDIAISLGLYLCERSNESFKDMFLTFETSPKFVKVSGSLEQRVLQTRRADWGGSTNIEAAYAEILRVAKMNGVSQSDMPEYLVVLTDMQFDAHRGYYGRKTETGFGMAKRMFEEAGYTLPRLIFWNLSTRHNQTSPVTMDENGTALIAGFSPAIMEAVLAGEMETFTPMNVMLKAIMSERYDYLA